MEEFQLLVNHSKGIYQLMFSLMLWTGLRVGETLAMQLRYLDLENLTYSVERSLNRHRELGTPKTEANRAKVSLSRFVGDWLERHRGEQAAERLRTPGW